MNCGASSTLPVMMSAVLLISCSLARSGASAASQLTSHDNKAPFLLNKSFVRHWLAIHSRKQQHQQQQSAAKLRQKPKQNYRWRNSKVAFENAAQVDDVRNEKKAFANEHWSDVFAKSPMLLMFNKQSVKYRKTLANLQ